MKSFKKNLSLVLAGSLFLYSASSLFAVATTSTEKILEDTLGNRIYASSSKFIFNPNYGYTEFQWPTKINVKINGVTWLVLDTMENSMSYTGFLASVSKGCTSSDLPDYENFNLEIAGTTYSVYGYKASSVTYEAVYEDGTTKNLSATQPVLFSTSTSYIQNENDLASVCGISTEEETENTSTTTTNTTTETSKEEEKAKIAEVTLPSDFTKEGSATTDLSSLTTEAAKSVSNFVLENKDVGKIEFLENVDLSEEATATKFSSLSDYVSIETGKVRIDSSGLSVLNKKAKITMCGLSFIEGSNVTILIDGEHVEGIISDVEYKEGTLSFEVTGFSTYEVRPTVVLDYSESTFDDSVTLKGTIDDLSSVVTIDGEEIQYDENGLFEIEYELEYGTNTFELVAENVNGAKYEETFSIIRNMTSEVYREVWTEQMVFFVLGGSLLASFGVGIGVFLLGKKLIKKVRIKKENKKILPVQEEKEMVNEMKEEVDEKLDDVGVE